MADMTNDEKIDSIWQMVKELAENDKRLEKGQKDLEKGQKDILDKLETTNERIDILAVDANKNKADIRMLKSTT